MNEKACVLGVDIGSVSISVAKVGLDKTIAQTSYRFHCGNIEEMLAEVLGEYDFSKIRGVASTSSTPPLVEVSASYDNRVSIIAACRQFHDRIGSILIVGGEKFGLLRFDHEGGYLNFKANTSCAAGTGSFLDQQARRLKLSGIEELSEIAYGNTGALPKIASRCAVFAKTDLVHAQQEGYSLAEICDGLCHGLAKNIADTLFSGEKPRLPLIFTGGVARNKAVVRHIGEMIGEMPVVEKTLYGAVGAAFNLIDEIDNYPLCEIKSGQDIIIGQTTEKKYYFPPLKLELSDYPVFESKKRYEYSPGSDATLNPVEVDIYQNLQGRNQIDVFMGIDIGSTSTKAVLMDRDRVVIAGFYTRTAGRPVAALQQILAAVEHMAQSEKLETTVLAAGTTGAGRKFVGKIIGADMAIDEITAHARAAYELDPDVDTIIEIGGQDSKFTTLTNGTVTFSVMNTVCAAGTGSFIEEQAQRLECPLADYSGRTEGRCSPISSDRCTVFMERDINHYLTEGYEKDDVLASVLHSIRENYLTKVAVENNIGNNICFQGATARNKALVAAFEQRLKKPIHVSKYCHLTGALGVALILDESGIEKTDFKGVGLYKEQIPIRSEVCQLCTNHCKLTVARVQGEDVAYGFLCGRDYDTGKFVNNNHSGFDLMKARKKAFAKEKKQSEKIVVGLPAALHMQEDLPMWKKFFEELSIETVTSEPYREALKMGKKVAGAEFCAPMAAVHGHVEYLLKKCDYVFLPYYLEKKSSQKGVRRQFCYYTQYSPSVVSGLDKGKRKKLLTPLVHYLYSAFYTKSELYRMCKRISGGRTGFLDVSAAYDRAREFKESGLTALREMYRERSKVDGFHVVLLGRPYVVLSDSMNKGIPNIFASLGVQVFSQDMVSVEEKDIEPIRPLLNELHWHYASEILKTAEKTAKTKGAYPVLITCFKCSPDSFAIDYFKKIMEAHGKPYLVLQLDEHDSSVGYETRIEAAVRSFGNHYRGSGGKPPEYSPSLVPRHTNKIGDKTLIMPNWDDITLKLLVAHLKSQGVDARLLNENEETLQRSLRHNTGQCIPLNIIAQGFIDYVKAERLAPEKTLLWQFPSAISCNIGMYPHHIKSIFDEHGEGFEKAEIYNGSLSFSDISYRSPLDTYFVFMFGGLVKKLGCRIRPYEKVKGNTDQVIAESIEILADAFLENRDKEDAVEEVVKKFEQIEKNPDYDSRPRPKVAIFGDMYVRDNDVLNQGLIHFIEDNGGEVVTTPYSSYLKMIAKPYLKKWMTEGDYLVAISSRALFATVTMLEKRYYRHFARILCENDQVYDESPEEILSKYNIRLEQTGESLDNILKIFYLSKHYPDLSLFVQLSPAFCCPALVTEAMAGEIESKIGVPVVSITYDGTGGNKNDAVIPYLKFPRNRVKTDIAHKKA